MSRHLSQSRVAALTLALALAASACASGPVSEADSPSTVPAQFSPGDPIEGAKAYRNVCASCHGVDLAGVEGLGPALLPSGLIMERSDEDLVHLIIGGRPADHPDSVSGKAMLARGGNPALTDQDIANIVAYLKARQP